MSSQSELHPSLSCATVERISVLNEKGKGRRAIAKELTDEGHDVSEKQVRAVLAKLRAHAGIDATETDPKATLSPSNTKLGQGKYKQPARRIYPKGWEPRVEQKQDEATATSGVYGDNVNPDEDDVFLIEGWGLNPDEWEIVRGTLRVNRWQSMGAGGEQAWQKQFKAQLRRRSKSLIDYRELEKIISKRGPLAAAGAKNKKTDFETAFVLPIADLQAGKKESGGSHALVERWMLMLKNLTLHLEELREIGRLPKMAFVPFMGDLIETCVAPGQGMSNTVWTCDLNQREQERLALRLSEQMLDIVAENFEKVLVSCVPGNHGERRAGNGNKLTSDGDNYDITIVEWLAAMYGKNPERYSHMSFVLPNDERTMTFDVAGSVITIAHGDQFRGGANAAAKSEKWWKDVSWTGFTGARDANILISAHYHHFSCVDHGNFKTWIQCPAMEGSRSSKWFSESGGATGSRQGVLCFITSEGRISRMEVLDGEERL